MVEVEGASGASVASSFQATVSLSGGCRVSPFAMHPTWGLPVASRQTDRRTLGESWEEAASGLSLPECWGDWP